MPSFDLIVFDLDGTLVDSAPDIATALDLTLAEAGFPTLGADRVRSIIGEGATRLVQRALPVGAVGDVAPLVARFEQHYEEHLCRATSPYPGVIPVLDELGRRTSHRSVLSVLTNKPGDLARVLIRDLGLADRFAEVVGDGDGYARKPSPDAVIALGQRHGAPASRTLVVGDGLPDVGLARAAGCPVAAALWGYVPRSELEAARPDWLVSNPRELLAITSP